MTTKSQMNWKGILCIQLAHVYLLIEPSGDNLSCSATALRAPGRHLIRLPPTLPHEPRAPDLRSDPSRPLIRPGPSRAAGRTDVADAATQHAPASRARTACGS